ncbi:MAG TPA: hypothetical protein VJ954_05620 [Ignavibacteriaceae bacterium]|nr:hypothetical protein [Ignavibacteriaceae bacterium]
MTGLELETGKETIETHEELLEESLEICIPVAGHQDDEALKMFLGSAEEDDDFDDEEGFDDEFEDNEIDEPIDDKEILDEDFDFDDDEDDDLFDDEDPQYN